MRRFTTLAVCATLTAQSAFANCSTDAMLVFDGSASMSEIGFDTKDATRIQEARQAVAEFMPQVQDLRRIGLLTYGPGGQSSCTGISLRFLPQTASATPMIAEIDALRPGGLTPLVTAVEQAAEALQYRDERGVVVLVTDGNETCGGTPCATSARMMQAARDLTVHVIGFRFTREFFAWNNPEQTYGEDTVAKCFADQTGGLFVTAETVDELVQALQRTLGCPVIGRVQQSTQALPG